MLHIAVVILINFDKDYRSRKLPINLTLNCAPDSLLRDFVIKDEKIKEIILASIMVERVTGEQVAVARSLI